MSAWNRNGHKYGMSANGSKLEKSVGETLKLRVMAGEIKDLEEQVKVQICCQDPSCPTNHKIHSIVDFAATDCEDGSKVYIEAKGFETDVWRIKRRLWMHNGPGELQIYKGNYHRPILSETITPKCAAISEEQQRKK